MGLTARISRERSDPEWDGFVARCPDGHHEQTSLWSEVKGAYGWRPTRIVVANDNQIIGGVQILARRIGQWGRIGYVAHGPLVISSDPGLIDLILRLLDRAAANEKLAYLAVAPPYNGHIFEPGLQRLGFSPKPRVLPPAGLMTATLVLDLSQDLDSLMARMRRTMRQNIRTAARKGVTVCEGTDADVEVFRQLMWALCERRGCSPTPPQKDFFQRAWKAFRPSGFVRLFIAELDGHAISALFTFPFGNVVKAWKIGWAGDHADSSPNKMLYWEAICWSKRNGYRFFDFVSIEKDIAQELQQGGSVNWTAVTGPSNLKVAFGGRPILLPDAYYRFYHPLLRAFARAGGIRLIESHAVGLLLERFWDAFRSPTE